MYVRSISADRWADVYNYEEKTASPEIADLHRLVKRLDGKEYTIVTLSGDGDAHMAIGGGAGQYVVYATYDNMKFWNLLSAAPSKNMVLLNVGGQEGDYPSRHVVSIDMALQAARVFLETGQLDHTLIWEDA